MAEVTRYDFTYKEVVEALLKQQGIHEGIWGLLFEFGLAASNIGPSRDSLTPAAVIGVKTIGLQRFEEESNIAVDAARVNPAKSNIR
jgi:hypothetical protein